MDFEPFRDGKFIESEMGLIPAGWRVGCLDDIANIIMGQSPAGNTYNESGIGHIFYQGRTEFGVRFPKVRLFTSEAKKIVDPGSILLSVRAPVGDINITTALCCIGRGLAGLSSKDGNNTFLFYLLLNLKPQLDVYNGEGTVFGCIGKSDLAKMPVLLPVQQVMEDFNAIVSPLDDLILTNYIQTCNLADTRDTLLPKLMSGELSVEEAERQL